MPRCGASKGEPAGGAGAHVRVFESSQAGSRAGGLLWSSRLLSWVLGDRRTGRQKCGQALGDERRRGAPLSSGVEPSGYRPRELALSLSTYGRTLQPPASLLRQVLPSVATSVSDSSFHFYPCCMLYKHIFTESLKPWFGGWHWPRFSDEQLRLREVKSLSWSHTASTGGS